MLTIGNMREAWTYALAEIDAAIAYLEKERTCAECSAKEAADDWLVSLHRHRAEYCAMLVDYPTPQCPLITAIH